MTVSGLIIEGDEAAYTYSAINTNIFLEKNIYHHTVPRPSCFTQDMNA